MHFDAVLFNIVENCNIKCRHCGYADSDRNGIMTKAQLIDWVGQAIDYGISHVIFTGGEPFTKYDLLKAGMDTVFLKGGTTGIFTNGWWGKTYNHAFAMLQNLPSIKELYLSSDRYHLEFVPIENIFNVIFAAKNSGVESVTICITYTTEKEKKDIIEMLFPVHKHIKFHYGRVIRNDYINKLVPDTSDELYKLVPENYSTQCFLHTPLVNPTGAVTMCHIGKEETHRSIDASPYFLGNLKNSRFVDIFDRSENNYLYQLLRVCGPRAVVEAAFELEDDKNMLHQRFASDCDMCHYFLSRKNIIDKIDSYASDSSARWDIFIKRHLILGDISQGINNGV